MDQTDLERWFGNARLQYYLDAQLERSHADKIRVERLRFIRRGQLDDPRQRALLREFIRLHDPFRGSPGPENDEVELSDVLTLERLGHTVTLHEGAVAP